MHSFNNMLFCGLPGLNARVGERVRWHLLGVGGPLDIHTPTFHGGAVTRDGTWRPTLDIYPGMSATVDQEVATPGDWLLECGVNDHWLAGMRALLSVIE
jgi:FtsP/CotA-like multicopper oxidase with cupredoxin domain